MHKERIEFWQHQHAFNLEKRGNENRTSIVVVITFVTMIVEITVGWFSNSMALYADGWHMGTHAFALGISLLAYVLARKYSKDDRFTFGTWKIEILGAYSSAIVLGIVGVIMIFTSVERMLNPLEILYDQALIVAVVGLIINVISALVLSSSNHSLTLNLHHDDHHDNHDHDDHNHHDYGNSHEHADLNLKSAYLHVIADTVTSVMAIIALLGAKYYSLNWLDPFVGIVGAGLILRWSISLLRDTSTILLDRDVRIPLANEIKEKMESDGDTKVSDLHLWKVEQNRYACIVSLVTGENITLEDYKTRLNGFHELIHVTIEVNACT